MKVNNNGQKQFKGKPCIHKFKGVKGEAKQGRNELETERKGKTAHEVERTAGGGDMVTRLML